MSESRATAFPQTFPGEAAATLTKYFLSGLEFPSEPVAEAAWTLLGYGLAIGYGGNDPPARGNMAASSSMSRHECADYFKAAAGTGGIGIPWDILFRILIDLLTRYLSGGK